MKKRLTTTIVYLGSIVMVLLSALELKSA